MKKRTNEMTNFFIGIQNILPHVNLVCCCCWVGCTTHENLWYFGIMCRKRVYTIQCLVYLYVVYRCQHFFCFSEFIDGMLTWNRKEMKINKFHLFLDFYFYLISTIQQWISCVFISNRLLPGNFGLRVGRN